MTDFAFSGSPLPVRAEIGDAHCRVFERIARPGAWWSGAERVAIAAEVRRAHECALCAERRAALSPSAVAGEHRSEGPLAAPAVEVIHRVVTDPARLSKKWFDGILAAGLGDGPYVELLGVVVAVVSIDVFCRGIGVAPHPLPEPEPGGPSRHRPEEAVACDAWVPMFPARRSKGPDADILFFPHTPNVIRAMSLVPDAVRDLMTLSAVHYLPPERTADPRAGRALGRPQMELVAGRVSALNECFY